MLIDEDVAEGRCKACTAEHIPVIRLDLDFTHDNPALLEFRGELPAGEERREPSLDWLKVEDLVLTKDEQVGL